MSDREETGATAAVKITKIVVFTWVAVLAVAVAVPFLVCAGVCSGVLGLAGLGAVSDKPRPTVRYNETLTHTALTTWRK